MDLKKAAEKFVKELLSSPPTTDYPYHNLEHTMKVVNHVKFLGNYENVDPGDMEKLIVAAWFHDSGYSVSYHKHEEKGILIAKKFLSERHAPNALNSQIEHLIRATIMPQNPQNAIEGVLCDADMFHLSQEDIVEQSLALWKESNMVNGRNISRQKYLNTTLKLLTEHHYFTNYGKNKLERKKEANIRRVMDYLNENL